MPSSRDTGSLGLLPAHGLRFGQEIPGVGTQLVLATRSGPPDTNGSAVELGFVWWRGSRQRWACFTATARGEPFSAPGDWPAPTSPIGIAQGDPMAPGLWEYFDRPLSAHSIESFTPGETGSTDYQLAD